MAEREQVHDPADDYGVQVRRTPYTIPGTARDLPLPSKVVPDADELEAKGYTGDNAPWRK